MFDMGSASTLYSCLFDYDHSFIVTFCVGTLRFGIHDVFYALHFMHEGYGDYIIRIFESSFLSFLSPYYLSLRYVPCLKTTLRPWLHTFCLTTHTWAILEISRRLFLRAWWMGSWDDDLHWSIPLLSVMDFQRRHYLHWGIPRSSMTVSLWDGPTLGHSHFRERDRKSVV